MSILFQKLKALTTKSSTPVNSPGSAQDKRLQKSQNVYTFRRMIFSPRGAMLIFATIAGFSIISFYGLSFLKSHLDNSSNKAIIVQRSHQVMNPDSMIAQDPSGVDPETGLPYDPQSLPGDNSQPPKEPIIEFQVPEFFLTKTKMNNEPDTNLQIPSAPVHSLASVTLPLIDNQLLSTEKSIYSENIKKKKTLEHLPVLARPNPTTQSKITQRVITPFFALKTKLRKSSTPQKDITTTKQAIKEDLNRMVKEKKTRKVSRIATLSTDLEDAVGRNDTVRTNQLLDQLVQEKGKNQPYILKLMAYKQIQKKNYDLAKHYLKTILAKDKNDFEAGINMAIIQIRQQEFSQAKKRLIALRELYPSQTIIDELLDQL